MKNRPIQNKIILAAVLIACSLFYWAGLSQTPFHPDESTQIFMSSDVELFLANPANLFWLPEKAHDLRQHYRELDAPLTRTWVGLARLITRQPALPNDWVWSLNWAANVANGALPSTALLLTARFAIALLFPFTLWLMWSAGKKLLGNSGAWLALLLTASSALVLIHTRRAMAEGWLVFAVALFIWVLACRIHSPVWLGTASALAFCAKQSAAPLLIIAALILLVTWVRQKARFKTVLRQGVLFTLTAGGLILLLHPFLWLHPVQAVRGAVQTRRELLDLQVAMFRNLNPDSVLDTPAKRTLGSLANLFFTPPAIEETANYIADLEPGRSNYLARPVHNLFRGLRGGALFFTLFVFGVAFTLGKMRKNISEPQNQAWLWVLLSFVALGGGVIGMAPLPFQRYIMPLAPFTFLYAAATLAWLTDTLFNSVQLPRRMRAKPK